MDDFCGTPSWQPWKNGDFTPCFEGIVITGIVFVYMFVAGSMRLRQLPVGGGKVGHTSSTVHFFKVAVSVLLALQPVIVMIVHASKQDAPPFRWVAEMLSSMTWSFSILVLHVEYTKGCRHSWHLKAFWTLALSAAIIRLRSEINKFPQTGATVDFALFLPCFLLRIIMFTLGFWFVERFLKRYGSLDNLLLRRGAAYENGRALPEEHSSFFSKMTFRWFNPVLRVGVARPLSFDDLVEPNHADTAQVVAERFSKLWHEERAAGDKARGCLGFFVRNPFLRLIIRAFGPLLTPASLCKLGQDLCVLGVPFVLRLLLKHINEKDENKSYSTGVMYAFILFALQFFQTIFLHQYFHRVFRVGMHIRTAVVAMVYAKSLRLSPSAKQSTNCGKITDLMSADAQKLMSICPYLNVVWSGPLQIIVCLILLYSVIGWSAFSGVAVMILLIPTTGAISKKLGSISKQVSLVTDERLRWINEALEGIKIIKMYAWESAFKRKITNIRDKEANEIRRSVFLKSFDVSLSLITPVLVAVVTFITYSLAGNELTSATAFTALVTLNILRFPLAMLPEVFGQLSVAYVSLKRLETFLDSEEVQQDHIHRDPAPDNGSIKIDKVDFVWGETTVLHNVELDIQPGQLVMVVGSVGSGKSSLLSSILGETTPKPSEQGATDISGRVRVSGSLAYVSQESWIMNATLRDNILFGLEYDEARYHRALKVCELYEDIKILPAGDKTEIGERGINLSGGQKQRVSMARAVYSGSDILLLDDPLSALDSNVGRKVFANCVQRHLHGRTRILCTHQLQFLSAADLILVIKDGRLAEVGSYEELMASSSTPVFHSLMSFQNEGDMVPKFTAAEADVASVSVDLAEGSADFQSALEGKGLEGEESEEEKAAKGALMSKEEVGVGGVTSRVFRSYLNAAGGSWMVTMVFIAFTVGQMVRIGTDYWLAVWSNEQLGKLSGHLYMWIYVIIAFLGAFLVFLRGLTMAYAGIQAAQSLHTRLLRSLLRAPMSFFHQTPTGRIINRFSSDQSSLDTDLPTTFSRLLNEVFVVLGSMVVISVVLPWFLIPLVFIFLIYRYVKKYYTPSSMMLKRLDSTSRSPIYAHFGETLNGLSVIRSFAAAPRFVAQNEGKIDYNNRAYIHNVTSNRWLGVRLEFLGALTLLITAMFSLGLGTQRTISSGMAGFLLVSALNFTEWLGWVVRRGAEAENQLNAVERVLAYVELEHEAPNLSKRDPPADWPTAGKIEITDYSMQYRVDLEPALRNLNLVLQPGEKIGVVGRTGAGKSTLMVSLLRLVEGCSGTIMIDGVDISKVGLHKLRSSLSVIPQDPVLFSGTVRSNLDPFEEYSDAHLMEVLEDISLKTHVVAMAQGLHSVIAEKGDNWSVGQKQLLCLGRALLRGSKIIIMDEATSSIDVETDAKIQGMIKDRFPHSTVLTIAHRLSTVINYVDRIMVLDAGAVVEIDTPNNLKNNPDSKFLQLLRAQSRGLA